MLQFVTRIPYINNISGRFQLCMSRFFVSKQCIIGKCLTKGRKLLFELFIIFFTCLLVCGRAFPGGVLPYKSDGVKIYQNLVLWACPKFIPPLRGTNSTTTNYITALQILIYSEKDNYRTLSSEGLFETIIINLTETTGDSSHFGF